MKFVSLLGVTCCVSFVYSMKLPSYFKPCMKNDPNINECAKKSAQDSFEKFVKTGDRKYNIPVIDPLHIIELDVDHGGLELIFNNMTITGLSEIQTKDVKLDHKKQHEEFTFYVPHLTILSKYKALGKVLIMPVQGDGDCNMTLVGLTISMSHDYTLGPGKTGNDHMTVVNAKLSFVPKKAYFSFENMFKGDKRMGSAINLFLNENWKEIVEDIGPSVGEAMGAVVAQIYNGLTSKVPFHEVYPEKA